MKIYHYSMKNCLKDVVDKSKDLSVLNVTETTHAIPFVFAIYIAVVSYILNLLSEYE